MVEKVNQKNADWMFWKKWTEPKADTDKKTDKTEKTEKKGFLDQAGDFFEGAAKNFVGGATELFGDVIAGRDNPALTQTINHVQETLISAIGKENVQNVIDGNFPALSFFTHTGAKLTDTGLNVLAFGLKSTGLDQKLSIDTDKLNTTDIGAALLMMDKVEDEAGNEIYSARKDCWQRSVGYNDLWDFGFGLGTSMRRDNFEFQHEGKDIMLWAWKGDYINLGAGAELGIYTRHESTNHWVVEDGLELDMKVTLKDKENVIIDNYHPKETQWWITAFNADHKGVDATNLTAEYTVDFSGSDDKKKMYQSFYERWGNEASSGWTFDKDNYKATFSF